MSFVARRGPERFARVRALVSGGSSGIGLCVARRLVTEGADVAILARDRARLSRAKLDLLAARLRKTQSVATFSVDLRAPAAVAALPPRIEEELGGVDLLVNNAGIAHPGRFEELDDAAFVEAVETNHLGAVRLTRALLPPMLERGRGHVAFVSSVAGRLGVFGYTAYGSSKFALTGFAEALRQELRPRGVGVSIVFPPDTDTPQLAAEASLRPAETRALSGSLPPLPPERVAAALLDGIAAGRFHVVVDPQTRLLLLACRLFPGPVRRLMDRTVARARTAK